MSERSPPRVILPQGIARTRASRRISSSCARTPSWQSRRADVGHRDDGRHAAARRRRRSRRDGLLIRKSRLPKMHMNINETGNQQISIERSVLIGGNAAPHPPNYSALHRNICPVKRAVRVYRHVSRRYLKFHPPPFPLSLSLYPPLRPASSKNSATRGIVDCKNYCRSPACRSSTPRVRRSAEELYFREDFGVRPRASSAYWRCAYRNWLGLLPVTFLNIRLK